MKKIFQQIELRKGIPKIHKELAKLARLSRYINATLRDLGHREEQDRLLREQERLKTLSFYKTLEFVMLYNKSNPIKQFIVNSQKYEGKFLVWLLQKQISKFNESYNGDVGGEICHLCLCCDQVKLVMRIRDNPFFMALSEIMNEELQSYSFLKANLQALPNVILNMNSGAGCKGESSYCMHNADFINTTLRTCKSLEKFKKEMIDLTEDTSNKGEDDVNQ